MKKSLYLPRKLSRTRTIYYSSRSLNIGVSEPEFNEETVKKGPLWSVNDRRSPSQRIDTFPLSLLVECPNDTFIHSRVRRLHYSNPWVDCTPRDRKEPVLTYNYERKSVILIKL